MKVKKLPSSTLSRVSIALRAVRNAVTTATFLIKAQKKKKQPDIDIPGILYDYLEGAFREACNTCEFEVWTVEELIDFAQKAVASVNSLSIYRSVDDLHADVWEHIKSVGNQERVGEALYRYSNGNIDKMASIIMDETLADETDMEGLAEDILQVGYLASECVRCLMLEAIKRCRSRIIPKNLQWQYDEMTLKYLERLYEQEGDHAPSLATSPADFKPLEPDAWDSLLCTTIPTATDSPVAKLYHKLLSILDPSSTAPPRVLASFVIGFCYHFKPPATGEFVKNVVTIPSIQKRYGEIKEFFIHLFERSQWNSQEWELFCIACMGSSSNPTKSFEEEFPTLKSVVKEYKKDEGQLKEALAKVLPPPGQLFLGNVPDQYPLAQDFISSRQTSNTIMEYKELIPIGQLPPKIDPDKQLSHIQQKFKTMTLKETPRNNTLSNLAIFSAHGGFPPQKVSRMATAYPELDCHELYLKLNVEKVPHSDPPQSEVVDTTNYTAMRREIRQALQSSTS